MFVTHNMFTIALGGCLLFHLVCLLFHLECLVFHLVCL